MMQIEQLIECFAHEDKEIRQQLDFVIEIFTKHNVLKPKLAKRHFAIITEQISEEISTDLELAALQKALIFCYEHYVIDQPDLIPPTLRIHVRSQRPFFNEATARLADVGAVITFARNNISNSNQSIKALSAVILLAEHCCGFELEELFYNDELSVLPDANRALICNQGSYLLLNCTSLLLWRQLRDTGTTAIKLRAYFKAHYQHSFGHIQALDEAISAISMMNRPIFINSLNDIATPIPASELICQLTNQPVKDSTNKKVSNIRRRWQGDIKNDVKSMASIAFGCKPFDSDAIAALSLTLRRFKNQSENELRNCKEFHDCRLALLNLRQQCTTSCSVVCFIIIHYCISLFLNGSPWKNKLAVNTVTTYLSTLHKFCRTVFSDALLLRYAQTDNDALFEISEFIEDHLANFAPDKQNTILIFLQYVNEYVPVRLVDSSLDFCSLKTSQVRAHYLSPQKFENAIVQMRNEQICWFLRLCYFFGLRYDEALKLHVIDISNNFVYVTKRSKRKSKAAIRRITLMFMPQNLRDRFMQFVKYRIQLSKELFDATVVEFYLADALKLLRQTSGIENFVVHSLRHCAANNMLFLLVMAAQELTSWRERYELFQHELFSEENILQLNKQFKMAGRKLSELTSVLNLLSVQLGHSSPVVSAASYLHFLPFIDFELNYQRKKAPELTLFSSLITKNSYLYQCIKADFVNEEIWFKRACRGLPKVEFLNKVKTVTDEVFPLTFHSYLNSLYEYLCTDKSNQVFKNIHDVPAIDPSVLCQFLHQPSNLRWVEHISKIKWNAKKVRAINTLHKLLIAHLDILDVRTFSQVLFAFDLLGCNPVKVTANVPNAIPSKWLEIANKFKCEIELKTTNCGATSVTTGSFRSSNKQICHLLELCNSLTFFIIRLGKNDE